MAVKLLDAVLVTGASDTWGIRRLVTEHVVQLTMGGTVVATAVTIDLEGSLDDVTFFTLISHPLSGAEIIDEGVMFHVNNKLVKFVRVNLTTLTGGTDPTITVLYDGEAFK